MRCSHEFPDHCSFIAFYYHSTNGPGKPYIRSLITILTCSYSLVYPTASRHDPTDILASRDFALEVSLDHSCSSYHITDPRIQPSPSPRSSTVSGYVAERGSAVGTASPRLTKSVATRALATRPRARRPRALGDIRRCGELDECRRGWRATVQDALGVGQCRLPRHVPRLPRRADDIQTDADECAALRRIPRGDSPTTVSTRLASTRRVI